MPSDQFAQIQAAVTALFDVPVAVAVNDPKAPQPALLDDEFKAVADAIPARQREFAAGRATARAAMAQLGMKPAAIRTRADRAPIWPAGVVGSISHTDGFCIAALCRNADVQSLGVDIEDATPLEQDLIPMICSEVEQNRIAGPDAGQLAKLIFSAKEAAYKAQYPISGLLFDFDQLEVTLEQGNGSFVAIFVKPAPPFKVGDTLSGRFVYVADHLVTTVAIGQDTPKGA